jgi:hypothetical protein
MGHIERTSEGPAAGKCGMTDLFDKRLRRNLDGGRVISIRGAREHNLKNVELEIPRDKLVIFTGLSGSGKKANGATWRACPPMRGSSWR